MKGHPYTHHVYSVPPDITALTTSAYVTTIHGYCTFQKPIDIKSNFYLLQGII